MKRVNAPRLPDQNHHAEKQVARSTRDFELGREGVAGYGISNQSTSMQFAARILPLRASDWLSKAGTNLEL